MIVGIFFGIDAFTLNTSAFLKIICGTFFVTETFIFSAAIPGYSISAIIPRRREKSKIFLSVVKHVVKAAFVPLSAIGENPANAGVARLCGVSQCPVPDTATALPNQARCQTSLRPDIYLHLYMKIFSVNLPFLQKKKAGKSRLSL